MHGQKGGRFWTERGAILGKMGDLWVKSPVAGHLSINFFKKSCEMGDLWLKAPCRGRLRYISRVESCEMGDLPPQKPSTWAFELK